MLWSHDVIEQNNHTDLHNEYKQISTVSEENVSSLCGILVSRHGNTHIAHEALEDHQFSFQSIDLLVQLVLNDFGFAYILNTAKHKYRQTWAHKAT